MVPNAENTIVIGGGPGGASAAIYLARYRCPVLVFDAPAKVHGRTAHATSLENFLGHTGLVTGENFLERVGRQMDGFGIERRNEKVTKVEARQPVGFTVTTEGGVYAARYLIVAVGITDTMPNIEGLEAYYQHSVFRCPTCDWYQNRGKRIIIVADDDAGLTLAIELAVLEHPPAMSVIASRPGVIFSDSLQSEAAVFDIHTYSSPLIAVEGGDGFLQRVRLADATEVEADIMVTALGYSRLDLFLDAGSLQVERDKRGFIRVDPRTCESSYPDLFAVGPCNDGPDQVVIAAGEGALAATTIERRIISQLKFV